MVAALGGAGFYFGMLLSRLANNGRTPGRMQWNDD